MRCLCAAGSAIYSNAQVQMLVRGERTLVTLVLADVKSGEVELGATPRLGAGRTHLRS